MQRRRPLLRIGLPGLAVVLMAALTARTWFELRVTINGTEIPIKAVDSAGALPLRVAVLGDLHVGHGAMDLKVVERVLDSVVAERTPPRRRSDGAGLCGAMMAMRHSAK